MCWVLKRGKKKKKESCDYSCEVEVREKEEDKEALSTHHEGWWYGEGLYRCGGGRVGKGEGVGESRDK